MGEKQREENVVEMFAFCNCENCVLKLILYPLQILFGDLKISD